MTPAAARASYRRQLTAVGEVVALRRANYTPDAQVLARVTGYQPQELVGDIQQGDRHVIMLAEDVETATTAGWPGPPVIDDQIIVRDRTLTIIQLDGSTRRIAGTLVAYDIVARG